MTCEIDLDVVGFHTTETETVQGGPAGASAYQIALAHGFVGSEAAWLESLKAAALDYVPIGPTVEISTPVPAVVIPLPASGYEAYRLEVDRIATIDGDFLKLQLGYDPNDPLSFEAGAAAYFYSGHYTFSSIDASTGADGAASIKVGLSQNAVAASRLTLAFSEQGTLGQPTTIESVFNGWRGFAIRQGLTAICPGRTARIAHLKLFCEYDSIRHIRYSLSGRKSP